MTTFEIANMQNKTTSWNRLLKRQVKRHLGGMDNLTPEMLKFLESVNRSYHHYEEDRMLLERSMDISSDELRETNERLVEESVKQKTILDKLKSSLKTLFSLEIGFKNVEIQNDEDVLEIIELIEQQSEKIKEVEEELLLIQNFINQSNDSIEVADSDGYLVFVNERAEYLLEKSKKELYGKRVFEVDNKFKNSEKEWTALKKELDKQEILLIERNQKFEDGSMIPTETSIKSIQVNDKQYIIGVSRDVTERKEAEEQQQKLIKHLKRANEELENFAYVISHDLKAPLRGIGSLTDMLMMDFEEELNGEAAHMLNLISGRVQRMNNLINGVLAYSRVDRTQEVKKELDLNILVHEVVDLLAAPAHFEITIEPNFPVIINEDIKIRQLFQNFVSNAIKYNDKEKGIVNISYKSTGDFWEFCIADNGPGIDSKYHKKIFQIFQTLERRDSFESTGIGLTIVKKIIENNKGSLRVESEVGQGAKFFFTLPKE